MDCRGEFIALGDPYGMDCVVGRQPQVALGFAQDRLFDSATRASCFTQDDTSILNPSASEPV